MDAQHNERRAKMLEKVRKLLSMARDGRGNQHEEEAALRQASKLMAEFGIAEAECDMAAIEAGEMIFGETTVTPDGKPSKEGKVYRSSPAWAGILAVGVAKFTDSIVAYTRTANGKAFVFRGKKKTSC